MKKLIIIAAIMFILAGCKTTTTIIELDNKGNETKRTISEKDPFDKVTESTQRKSIILWGNGWKVKIAGTIATAENPVPTVEIEARNGAYGYMSILPEQQNLDQVWKIISATGVNLEVDKDGISSIYNK